MIKSTTFFELLQKDKNLDLRDNRGKRHNMCLVLVEFVVALLCNRDGKMSSIYRHMKSHHNEIVKQLGLTNEVPQKQYQGLIYLFY